MTQEKNEQRVNFTITDGYPFFSHDMSINFNPAQFIFDFRCVTPRTDPRSNDGSRVMHLKHNVVMLEPYHAKQVLEATTKGIEDGSLKLDIEEEEDFVSASAIPAYHGAIETKQEESVTSDVEKQESMENVESPESLMSEIEAGVTELEQNTASMEGLLNED